MREEGGKNRKTGYSDLGVLTHYSEVVGRNANLVATPDKQPKPPPFVLFVSDTNKQLLIHRISVETAFYLDVCSSFHPLREVVCVRNT